MTVIERFLKFVSFDTTSSETSGQQPSTPNQKVLGGELVRQMLALGICDAPATSTARFPQTAPKTFRSTG